MSSVSESCPSEYTLNSTDSYATESLLESDKDLSSLVASDSESSLVSESESESESSDSDDSDWSES